MKNTLCRSMTWVAVLCGLAFPSAVRGAVSTSTGFDLNGTATLSTDAYWSGGAAPSKNVTGADETDFVLIHSGIRLPGSAFTCYGQSFQIGDAAHSVGAYLKGGPLTFQNTGLILARGTLGTWFGGAIGVINGPVTVNCLGGSSFTIENKQPLLNTGMRFTGAVSCPNAGHVLDLTANLGAQIQFAGGLSDFNGTIRAENNANLRVASSTSAAQIDVKNGATFGAYAATDVVAVRSLTLAAGAGLVVPLGGSSSSTVGLVRVTGTLSIPAGKRIPVTFEGVLARELDQEGRVLPILAVPKAVGLSADQFDFGELSSASSGNSFLPTIREVQVVAGETEDVLCLVTRRIASYNTAADAINTSGLAPDWRSRWNGHADGDDWNPDWDYVANKCTIREIDAPTNNWWTFGGHCLVLENGAVIAAKANCHLVIPNGVFNGGSLAHWGGSVDSASLALRPYAFGGTTFLSGRIRVASGASVTADSARTSVIDAELTGGGTFTFAANKGNVSTRYPDGYGPAYCELLGTNVNFAGLVRVNTAHTQPDVTNRATLVVANPHSLGGPLAAFAYNAVTLLNYGTLWAQTDVALAEATRGVYIEGNGQFEVSAGATLALRQPLIVNGTLHKAGAGTLALGGPVAFNVNTATPTAGKNLLKVHAGTVQAIATNALNGVTIAFDVGTALRVDPAASGDVADWGFVNTKTATPFDLANCPNGTIPVEIALPGDYEENRRTLTAAICTVPAATALTPASFAVAHPAGTRTAVTVRANADGTVTYFASVGAAGFAVIVR